MLLLSGISNFITKTFSFDPNSPLLFTQFYFWAFFALVFAVFALVKKRRILRNAFLFFVSLFFYYKTSGLSILILLFVTCSDFLISHKIYQAGREGRLGLKRFWLVLSVSIDLFLLFYFKYAYFFTDVVNTIFGSSFKVYDVFAAAGNLLSGGDYFRVDKIILPVGISFFIFQVISYTVDVYRGEVKPVRNVLDFGFYVSFFPQLVAGPIVRASEFIPQLYKRFFLSRKQFGIAVFWIINGLAKKLILSDFIAVNFIDRVFDNPILFTGFENLAALFGYSLQVYADFSGYTDIAIGVAMLMGFYLPQNFNSPYKAPNPQDFWRRWHMSLSRWLKAYLYIPLGGNRNSTFATWFCIGLFAAIVLILSGNWTVSLLLVLFAVGVVLFARFKPDSRKKIIANLNRFITMLLGGMWHGASWNFIIWGGLNGIGLIIYQFWKNMGWMARMILIALMTVALGILSGVTTAPIWNVLFVWMTFLCIGTLARFVYHHFHPEALGAYPAGLDAARAKGITQTWTSRLGNVWAVMQTFTFITFTRLFFRSGSNLDPATANEAAWNTAKNMVRQIGSPWNFSQIPAICHEYRSVFLLVLLGMAIHWLPARWKRWIRINFSMLPLPVMALIVVAVVFTVYQFITADLQAFIYFQF